MLSRIVLACIAGAVAFLVCIRQWKGVSQVA